MDRRGHHNHLIKFRLYQRTSIVMNTGQGKTATIRIDRVLDNGILGAIHTLCVTML